LCSSQLLRPEKPCYPATAGFHDFDPQSRYSGKYACGSKSLQLRVSLRLFNPRYVALLHNLG
jgi:hypothetical protein